MHSEKLPARPASPEDEETVIGLMRELYIEDGIVFDEGRARQSVRELISKPEHGVILLFSRGEVEATAEQGSIGYAVLTLGFTLEHGGRFVLLDELYLRESARGLGLGHEAIALAKNWALRQGVQALRVEVHRHNERAKSVYLKNGFTDDHRDILTLWLKDPSDLFPERLEHLSKVLSECTGAAQPLARRRQAWAGGEPQPLRFAPCSRSHGAPIAFRKLLSRNAITAAIRQGFPGISMELVPGDGRFMLLLDYEGRSFVIETDRDGSAGLSEIRTEADNWLVGHEHILERAEVSSVIGLFRQMVDRSIG